MQATGTAAKADDLLAEADNPAPGARHPAPEAMAALKPGSRRCRRADSRGVPSGPPAKVLSFSRSQAIEALNFQLSLLIITIVTLGIGGVLWAVAWIFSIVAAVNAANGHPFRYPFTIRLIR